MSIPFAQVRDPKTYEINGSGIAVHSELKHGFLEAVYKDSLEIEFRRTAIPAVREVEVPVLYKGERLKSFYRADFICYENLIVEVKAIKQMTGIDRAQVINYLRATRFEVAVLLNLGRFSLEYERIVLTNSWEICVNLR